MALAFGRGRVMGDLLSARVAGVGPHLDSTLGDLGGVIELVVQHAQCAECGFPNLTRSLVYCWNCVNVHVAGDPDNPCLVAAGGTLKV
jgi:hypothetical protein